MESSDTVVIAKAQEVDAILLSLNGDFSHIVNYPPKNYKGIVALQMHNHGEFLPKLIARLTAYLKMHATMDHYRGKLLVVEVDRIRIGSNRPDLISILSSQNKQIRETPNSEIWVQLGCNKTSREFPWAPEVAIGAVKLQLVTSGYWTVTAEVAH